MTTTVPLTADDLESLADVAATIWPLRWQAADPPFNCITARLPGTAAHVLLYFVTADQVALGVIMGLDANPIGLTSGPIERVLQTARARIVRYARDLVDAVNPGGGL